VPIHLGHSPSMGSNLYWAAFPASSPWAPNYTTLLPHSGLPNGFLTE